MKKEIGRKIVGLGCAGLGVVLAACVVEGRAPDVEPTAVSIPQSTGPKKRIGVVEFVNNAGGGMAIARNASDALAEFLVKSKAFFVFERDRMSQIMKEQALSMSGAVSAETAVKAGELMGLNAIVVGQIAELGREGWGEVRVTVRIRLLDTTTGQILIADSGTGKGSDTKRALNASLVRLVNNIFQAMEAQPWSGRIAAAEGGRIYVNAGSSAGLREGDRFEVREGGRPIKDPVTKMVIGFSKGNLKGALQAVEMQPELTGCISTKGGGYKVGDVVQLVPRRAASTGGEGGL